MHICRYLRTINDASDITYIQGTIAFHYVLIIWRVKNNSIAYNSITALNCWYIFVCFFFTGNWLCVAENSVKDCRPRWCTWSLLLFISCLSSEQWSCKATLLAYPCSQSLALVVALSFLRWILIISVPHPSSALIFIRSYVEYFKRQNKFINCITTMFQL